MYHRDEMTNEKGSFDWTVAVGWDGILNSMSSEVTRDLLECSSIEGMPGWESRLFLITYPPGADASNHSHPVVGIGYVLQGTMVTAFDDEAEMIFTAGQSFQDKATFHRVSRNGSQTEPMKFLIAYTVRKDESNTTWPR
jgi:quercetin dioxygenase-like cupin family protein